MRSDEEIYNDILYWISVIAQDKKKLQDIKFLVEKYLSLFSKK